MKLTRIEAHGFKSFADPVRLEIDAGVTAFVGPNGCGKSNVVDAIRWALGEQSVKSLRGTEMLDVIFSGSGQRPPMGLSEVTLTFDNADGTLPIPQSEVAVTRRLYRTGESEYLVNKQTCRLRDIKELFMNTGIGVDAYSVIEQGKIDKILTSNTKDRREPFDEAAGISRYRARVKSAQSRLERVETNLGRIRDILRELERQLRSIQRQAAKARKFKQVQEQYKTIRLEWGLHLYHEGMTALGACQAELAEARQASAEVQGRLDAQEALGREADAGRPELERRAQEARARLAAAESEAASLASALEVQGERLRETAQEKVRLEGRLAEAAEGSARAEEAWLAAGHRLSTHQAASPELSAQAERLSAESRELQARVGEVLKRIEGKEAEALERARRRMEVQNELTRLGQERETLAARGERHAQRLRELAPQLDALKTEQDRRTAVQQESQQKRQKLVAKVAYLREEVERLLKMEGEFRTLLESLKYRLGQAETRREAMRESPPEIPGKDKMEVLGQLHEFMKMPFAVTHAIEAGLGVRARHWVVKDLDGALRVLDWADHRHQEEVGLLPVRWDGSAAAAAPEPFVQEGVIGWACDLAQVEGEFRPLVARLLGKSLVVEDRSAALSLLEKGGPFERLLTLSGEVYEQVGCVRYLGEEGGLGATARIAAERKLTEEIHDLTHEIEQTEARRHEVSDKRQAIGSELDQAAPELAALDLAMQQTHGEGNDFVSRLAQLSSERDLLEGERAAADAELPGLDRKLEEAAAIQAALPADENAAPVSAEEIASRQELETCWRQKQEEAEAARKRFQQHREESLVMEQELKRAEGERVRFSSERSRTGGELAAAASRGEELQRQIAELTAKLSSAQETLPPLRTDVEAREAEREALHRTLREIERQAAEIRRELRTKEDRLAALRMKEQEHSLKLATVQEKFREDLGSSLAEAYAGYTEEPKEWEAVGRQCETLKQEMDRLGGADFDAINEESDLERRASFLRAQEEDLAKAREGLSQLIRQMNKASREMFIQTFEKVKANFEVTFRKIFGGGKADLILEEGVDVLDAGIEIVARPPGKEPRSISLLSGGEKSMTALALLFAIFQSRPSPFCILDEADAALDEANVDRYLGMLQEYLTQSQFLVITHNKRTMRIANKLYGVTQQEQGVSMPLPLKFEEVERKLPTLEKQPEKEPEPAGV